MDRILVYDDMDGFFDAYFFNEKVDYECSNTAELSSDIHGHIYDEMLKHKAIYINIKLMIKVKIYIIVIPFQLVFLQYF